MMYLFTICINYNFLVKTVLMKTKNSHKRKSTKLEEAPNGFLDHVNILTTLNFYSTVLGVERVVVQVHHAGKGRGEAHAVSDASVTI